MKNKLLSILLFLTTISFAQCLELTTSPQWVNIGDVDVTGNQLTVEAIVFYTGGTNVVSKHIDPSNVNYLLRMATFEITTTNGFYAMANPFAMSLNTWYHIAGTYDGANIRYYVNGCLVITNPATGNLFNQDLATAIGARSFAADEQYFGKIDEVRIWNVARTRAQIQASMNDLPSPTTQTGLLAYYQFTNNLLNAQGNATFNGIAMGAPAVYAAEPPTIITPTITALSTQNALCVNNTGTVGITATGSNIQYSINNSTYLNTSSFTGLATGTYTAYIKTAEGCVRQQPFIINLTPANPIIVSVTSPVSCSAGNTTLTASGATNYTWSPAGTLSSPNGNLVTANPLVNTIYNVVGATNACVSSNTVALNVRAIISGVVTQTNATCFGGNNGITSVVPSGGIAPYRFLWSTVPPQITQTATGLIAGTYSVSITNTTCASSGMELVTNGNFELGNTGFISSNTYQSPVNTGASEYFICTAAQIPSWGSVFSSLGDHTSGTGNMMIVNGADTPGGSVFCQTINVRPNANYNFSTWVSSIYPGSPALLQFNINGTPLGAVFSAPAGINVWSQFTSTWNSGINTSANICIINQNITAGGNDFALDDISFQECLVPCPITKTVTITEPANFAINVNPTSLCAGSSATLTASGATNYTWSPAASLNNSNMPTVIANPTINTTYTITGSNVIGCINFTTTTVSITASPNIISSSATICLGQQTATLIANGAAAYSWLPTTNLSSSTGSVVNASPTISTTYSITGTFANGCVSYTTANVVVNALPTITANSGTLCIGQQSVNLIANGALTYSWIPNTSLSATFGANVIADPNTTTTYSVVGVNANGCVNYTTTNVVVNPLPIITANDGTLCIGQQSVNLIANGAITYSWSPNTNLSNTFGANVIANPNITTTYSVAGVNANGCVNYTTTNVVVNPLPIITANNGTLCIGQQSVTLIANGANTYSWNPLAGLSSPIGALVIANPVVNTNYTITGTNSNGCTNTVTAQVTVNPLPIINATGGSICIGQQTIALTASGGVTYSWSPSTGLSNTFGTSVNANPTITTTYFVAGINANGCINYTTTNVVVNPLPQPAFSFTNNCINTQPNTFNAGASTVAVGTNTNYAWAFGDAQFTTSLTAQTTHVYSLPATYQVTLTVTSNNGCVKSLSQQVEVYQKPFMRITASSLTCLGSAITFTANTLANSGNVISWLWDADNSISTIETNGKNSSFVFPAAGTQTLTLVSITNNGCRDTLKRRVYINYNPNPQFAVDKPAGCPMPHCATFTNQTPNITAPAKIIRWNWNFGNTRNANATNGNAQQTCYTNTSSNQLALYSATLVTTTDSGCVSNIVKPNLITVYPKPVAVFSILADEGDVIQPLIHFTNQSIDYTKWYWGFGDGSNLDSINKNTHHFYESYDAKQYNTMLAVENQYQCTDVAYLSVEIKPAFTFFMPNAFSPENKDGVNDVFTGSGIGIAKYEMWIYDRWGTSIYYSDDINKGWNGLVQGKNSEKKSDEYVWRVNIIDVIGKKHEYIGHVTLL